MGRERKSVRETQCALNIDADCFFFVFALPAVATGGSRSLHHSTPGVPLALAFGSFASFVGFLSFEMVASEAGSWRQLEERLTRDDETSFSESLHGLLGRLTGLLTKSSKKDGSRSGSSLSVWGLFGPGLGLGLVGLLHLLLLGLALLRPLCWGQVVMMQQGNFAQGGKPSRISLAPWPSFWWLWASQPPACASM